MRSRLSALATVISLLACGSDAAGPGIVEVTGLRYGGGEFAQLIDSGGFPREYLVYVPPAARPSEPAPLILAYHGSHVDGAWMRDFTGLNQVAGAGGYVVAYLDSWGTHWAVNDNTPAARAGVSDVEFTQDVIDRIGRDIDLDPARVYAVGFSNGALFTHRAACSLSDRIAAVASVGATMTLRVASICDLRRPVPALFVLGDRDTEFPWTGILTPADGGMSADGTARWWADRIGCAPGRLVTPLPDRVDDGTTVEEWRHGSCPGGAEVLFYAVFGGGHTWPSARFTLSPSFGLMSRDVDATLLAVDFFDTHRTGG